MYRILQATGSLIDAIKINATARVMRDGRVFWVKKRRNWGQPVAYCANAFFRAAGNPVSVCTTQSAWRQWEVDSFRLLHGEEGYGVFVEDGAVWATQIPGEDLATIAIQERLTDAMFAAAACELRRAHTIFCPAIGGRWSHGDPHLGNFLFDAATNRARLIDFEVMHRPEIPEEDRHAEDLLSFLQDVMGSLDAVHWLRAATCFLQCYAQAGQGHNGAMAALRRKVDFPHGIGRVWWAIRTTYLSKAERDRRIAGLRRVLENF